MKTFNTKKKTIFPMTSSCKLEDIFRLVPSLFLVWCSMNVICLSQATSSYKNFPPSKSSSGSSSISSAIEPAFTMPLQNLTIMEGRNATFTCHVRQISDYKIGWVKADTKAIQAIGEIVITHNSRISVSGDRGGTRHHLHIENVELDDAGPYMCQLNTQPMRSQHGFLNVVVPADIVSIAGTDSIVEGSNAKLKCEATGFPAPEVSWRREERGQLLVLWEKSQRGLWKRSEVSVVEGNVLELNRISRSQMGNYLCIANNHKSPIVSKMVHVNVKFLPVISVPNQMVYAEEGQDVTIECRIEANPKGLHYWETEAGEMISANNNKFNRLDYTSNAWTVHTRLTIRSFSESDQGRYKCVCKNEMNEAGDRVEGVVLVRIEKEIVEETTTREPFRPEIISDFGQGRNDLNNRYTVSYSENGRSNKVDYTGKGIPSIPNTPKPFNFYDTYYKNLKNQQKKYNADYSDYNDQRNKDGEGRGRKGIVKSRASSSAVPQFLGFLSSKSIQFFLFLAVFFALL